MKCNEFTSMFIQRQKAQSRDRRVDKDLIPAVGRRVLELSPKQYLP
jgi:hypothetical protein